MQSHERENLFICELLLGQRSPEGGHLSPSRKKKRINSCYSSPEAPWRPIVRLEELPFKREGESVVYFKSKQVPLLHPPPP